MPTTSAPPYLSRLPLKLQNSFVEYFPRKYCGFLRHDVQDKYFFHPLLLSKPLHLIAPAPLPAGYRFGLLDDATLQQIIAHREAI